MINKLKFLVLVFVLISCKNVDYGKIDSMRHEPGNQYVTSEHAYDVDAGNGTSIPIYEDVVKFDDEDYIIEVYDHTQEDKYVSDTWYVTPEVYEQYKRGDYISFNPETMSRQDPDYYIE